MRTSQEVKKDLAEADDRRCRLMEEFNAVMMAENGYWIGMSVLESGKLYEVTRFDFNYGMHGKKPRPWAFGKMRKKDGTLGTAEHNLYTEWEKVAP